MRRQDFKQLQVTNLRFPPIEVCFSRARTPERSEAVFLVAVDDLINCAIDRATRREGSQAIFFLPSPVPSRSLLTESPRCVRMARHSNLRPVSDLVSLGFSLRYRDCHCCHSMTDLATIFSLFLRIDTLSAPRKTPTLLRSRRGKAIFLIKSTNKMVGPRGLEPRTSGLRVCRIPHSGT